MKKNIAPLLLSSGLNEQIPDKIEIDTHPGITEEYQVNPEDNWLHHVFKGFKTLKSNFYSGTNRCIHFVAVGTGLGVDAIGAYLILHPQFITITDINTKAIKISEANLNNNSVDITIKSLNCSLLDGVTLSKFDGCEELIPPDVIYANLPTLFSDSFDKNSDKAAAFSKKIHTTCPEILRTYQLELQYEFLLQVREQIDDRCSVILALGGRFPIEVIETLFESASFKFEEISFGFKIQAQPYESLLAYVKKENETNHDYIFFKQEELDDNKFKFSTVREMYDVSKTIAANAKEAMLAYQNGYTISHIVLILRAWKTT